MNARAIDVVQPDAGRIKGLTEAKRVSLHARGRGLAVVPIADSALRRDLCSKELPVVDGKFPLPTEPGLGISVNEEALARFRVSEEAEGAGD